MALLLTSEDLLAESETQMRPTVMRSGWFLMRHRCLLLSGGGKKGFRARERSYQSRRLISMHIFFGSGVAIKNPAGGLGMVSGRMNCRSPLRIALPSRSGKELRIDSGKVFSSIGLLRRPRAAFQKELRVKPFRHHSRQRSAVRRSAPRISRSFAIRFGVAPWRSAEIRTTTAPTNI